MSGGFMSQSIVTPEIDGAIRPFALFAQYEAKRITPLIRHSRTTENIRFHYQQLSESENKSLIKTKRLLSTITKDRDKNALTAAGMEVVPSLYNLLLRMKQEGYNVSGLPANAQELAKMIQAQGAVFNSYAEGAFDEFMKNGNPELITKEQYESWVKESLRPEKYAEVVAADGEFPGNYMVTSDGCLGVARLQFGNIVLMPQNAAGSGDNSFQVVHGTNAAPPHTYIASYYGCSTVSKLMHSFISEHMAVWNSLLKKQVALCSNDWPDRLVGTVPHFYLYSIGNVGEGMMAKRRSYATLQSYLTPPFLESSVRGIYRELMEKIKIYNNSAKENKEQESLAIKTLTVKMGIHRDLGLDSITNKPYTEDEIARIENFAEELATEKITGQLYTMGVPYEPERITSSVYAMATEPIAYSLLALDKQRGKATNTINKHRSLFTQQYLNPARQLVEKLITNPAQATDELICRTAGITPQELAKARQIEADRNAPKGMMAMMMAAAAKQDKDDKNKKMGGHPAQQSEKSPHEKIPESMKEAMKKMGTNMDPGKAMEMAKSMGASPEAIRNGSCHEG